MQLKVEWCMRREERRASSWEWVHTVVGKGILNLGRRVYGVCFLFRCIFVFCLIDLSLNCIANRLLENVYTYNAIYNNLTDSAYVSDITQVAYAFKLEKWLESRMDAFGLNVMMSSIKASRRARIKRRVVRNREEWN